MEFIVLFLSLAAFTGICVFQPFGLVWIDLAVFFAVQVWIWGFWFVPTLDDDWDWMDRAHHRAQWRGGWDAWVLDWIEPGSCWVQYASYRSVVPALLHLGWCKLRYRDREWEIHNAHQWL